jgi:mRNA interferase RelE/StbE
MYRLELTPRARRELDKLGREEFDHVFAAIQGLRDNPRPVVVRKLRGPIHRIRSGDWRIIYAVFDKDQLIIVGKVARHAEDTYGKVDGLF